MKNVKLFLKSLFSNNAAIDGARKKPWYAAVIIFLIALVLSLVPSTVLKLKEHGDKPFASNTYLTAEAVTDFSENYLSQSGVQFYVKENKDGAHYLISDSEFKYSALGGKFVFAYFKEEAKVSSYVSGLVDKKTSKCPSYFVFTGSSLYIRIVDPNDKKTEKVNVYCIDAYKKVEKDQIKKAFVNNSDPTKRIEKTWENWKILIKSFYNQTRLKAAWVTCGINAAVNAGIILIMGFMVWILTRGKNNPYRLFTIWESFKISFWCTPSPALLTLGLGFLISNFASTIFVLLLGVRVMWLTMKSLRPDGSGYAAN